MKFTSGPSATRPGRQTLAMILCAAAIGSLGVLAVARSDQAAMSAETKPLQETRPVPAPLNFTMKSLSGQDVDLSRYSGKVVLMVNTASKCGFTPQYAGLEKLHEKYAAQGLAILGFPSNDFGKQEPGSDTEISTFCTKNYGVQFDMFSKIDVKGPDQAPLYRLLTRASSANVAAGEVKWNFEKFLISRDGQIVARFTSKVKPESPEITSAIEAELAK